MKKLYLNKYWRHYFLAITTICLSGLVNLSLAQCPRNIDFEEGNFTGWQCYTGSVTMNTGVIVWNPVGPPVANRHVLKNVTTAGLDLYGSFPEICPNGSSYSIKLGNNSTGAQAEKMTYDFTIPVGADKFSLIYHYAVVVQDGGTSHPPQQQPRFKIDVDNLTDGTNVGCSSFNFVANSSIPGFEPSPLGTPTNPILYKTWSAASISLDGNAGKSFRITFTTADCSQGAHFGYAYFDVNTECSSAFTGASFCPDDTLIHVIAPAGYQGYKWFNIFNNILGTTQTLTLQPPPPSGDSVYVELTPYSGYGCLDTLTAYLLDTFRIYPNAGRDTALCNTPGVSVQLGEPPKFGLVYHWNPATGLNDPNISNPIASPSVSTQYILTVTHDGGGCPSNDTVNVNIVNLDTTLLVNGPISYCTASGSGVTLSVNLPADSIQWYLNGFPIAGAHSNTYVVTQTGDYFCTLFSFAGCSFNTRTQHIDIYQSPSASFSVNATAACFDGNAFSFVNTSSPPSGTPVYLWKFGDGATSANVNETHSYAAPGTYTVWMYISGDGGCIDSASKVITVRPSVKAGFKIDNAVQCFKNNRFNFTDTSRTTGGVGTINYTWDFGDGSFSNQQNPSHSYTTPGTYSVTLHADAGGGCNDQVSYNITVNPTPAAAFSINRQNQCYKGNQFIFTNSSTVFSGSLQYFWDLGDGTTLTTMDVTHVYGRAGVFTVKMKVSTPEGCADSLSVNVNVYPNPKADFSVENICINLPVPLNNKTVNNTTSTLNYLWDFGNGVSSTAANPNYMYPVPGNYSIMLQVSSAQCPSPTDTAIHSIVVDAPVRGITYPVVDAVILFPEPLKARDIGTSALWIPATSLDNYRSYKPHFEGKDPVLYRIQLKTPTGCITVDTQYVKTHKKIEIYVPTAFMPGGANVYLRPLCMGIDKVNYFRIYDRWGKLLFEMASDRPGWNGRIGNQQQEIQSVVWMIEAIDVDGNIHHRQGTTVLLH